MQAIYNNNDYSILQVAHEFRYGIFDEPGVKKYAGFDENENFLGVFYMGNSCFSRGDITGNIPEDIYENPGKYLFDEGRIISNPDWHEYVPEPSPEEKVSDLQTEIEELKALIESQAQFIEAQSEMIDFIIMNNM